MEYLWWAVFLLSLSSLVLLVLRNHGAAAWLKTLGLHVIAAAILLYAVNWVGGRYMFQVPINAYTLSTIGVLGIPGLALLVALKLTIVR
ncbi:pro-sigmaK processing inhibitor BofA family protein [Paenibacillus sp. YN15]|uniref:pro-sigmaK processing inhibitor BofA family protein n=1 Tax=Paenibacillus sp. YN15 TaxID=1742774 RepID=UPI000DCE3582|nr:pro-sigmaK processing inhibitor BofA family protein [Paenibacillus sp. YN15]RAU97868.1 pro-sigmaK processing inhibitor BofA [Paenibacillus sp. YN15]